MKGDWGLAGMKEGARVGVGIRGGWESKSAGAAKGWYRCASCLDGSAKLKVSSF